MLSCLFAQSFFTRFVENDLTCSAKMPVGQWTHVAFTVSREEASRSIFINGAMVAFDSPRMLLSGSGAPLNLGRFASDTSTALNGHIRQLRVWNRGLSVDDVHVGMETSITLASPQLPVMKKFGLVACWPFEGTLEDIAGAQHATALPGTTSPVFQTITTSAHPVKPPSTMLSELRRLKEAKPAEDREEKEADTLFLGLGTAFAMPSTKQLGLTKASFSGSPRCNVSFLIHSVVTAVECWVLLHTVGGEDQAILAVDSTGAVNGQGLHLLIRNACPFFGCVSVFNDVRFFLISLPDCRLSRRFFGNDVSCSTKIPVGQWTHLAFVYALPKKQHQIFVNGVLAPATSKGPYDFALIGDGKPLNLGRYLSKPDTALNGHIRQLRAWNRALSQDDIRVCMETSLSPSHPSFPVMYCFGLIACWPFEGTLEDIVGGLHATALPEAAKTSVFRGAARPVFRPALPVPPQALSLCVLEPIAFAVSCSARPRPVRTAGLAVVGTASQLSTGQDGTARPTQFKLYQ